MRDIANTVSQRDLDAAAHALVEQQSHDLSRAPVAEQLPQRLLVPRDAVAVDQRDEVVCGVARQRRLGEMRVSRQIAVGRGVQIGEVASSTP